MPDEYKGESVTESYHMYYNSDKQKMLKWTNRNNPEWAKLNN